MLFSCHQFKVFPSLYVVQKLDNVVLYVRDVGAGKTYTMLGTHDEPGIMARSLNDLFLEMHSTGDEMAYQVTMSYLEVVLEDSVV